MAIYHLSVQIIKRSEGKSATAAAAYRSGERIEDERTGEAHDYTRRSGVDHSAILAPSDAPSWVLDRAMLWNEVEKIEKRKDAQVAREIDIALPVELNDEQKINLISDFINKEFVSIGMVADLNIHDIYSHNPHAHVQLTTRVINHDGFGKKERAWNDSELLENWREKWALYANNALQAAGHSARIDHRSLDAQGINREPQIHLGKKNIERMEKGETNPRIERYKGIQLENDYRQVTKEISTMPDDIFTRLAEELDYMIELNKSPLYQAMRKAKVEKENKAKAEAKLAEVKADLRASVLRSEQLSTDLDEALLPFTPKAIKARRGLAVEQSNQSSFTKAVTRLKSICSPRLS